MTQTAFPMRQTFLQLRGVSCTELLVRRSASSKSEADTGGGASSLPSDRNATICWGVAPPKSLLIGIIAASRQSNLASAQLKPLSAKKRWCGVVHKLVWWWCTSYTTGSATVLMVCVVCGCTVGWWVVVRKLSAPF